MDTNALNVIIAVNFTVMWLNLTWRFLYHNSGHAVTEYYVITFQEAKPGNLF